MKLLLLLIAEYQHDMESQFIKAVGNISRRRAVGNENGRRAVGDESMLDQLE